MDNESTIPSQLGPIHTIPAPLVASAEGAAAAKPDTGSGLILKLLVAALGTALLVYLIR